MTGGGSNPPPAWSSSRISARPEGALWRPRRIRDRGVRVCREGAALAARGRARASKPGWRPLPRTSPIRAALVFGCLSVMRYYYSFFYSIFLIYRQHIISQSLSGFSNNIFIYSVSSYTSDTSNTSCTKSKVLIKSFFHFFSITFYILQFFFVFLVNKV